MVDALELSESVLKRLEGRFDDVAVLARQRDYVMVKLWNTEPSVTQSWIDTKVSVLVSKDGRVFSTELSVSDPDAVDNALRNVGEILAKLEPSEIYAPLPEPAEFKPLEGLVDQNVLKAMEEPGKYVEVMIDAALKEGAERVAGTLVFGRMTKALATNKGFRGMEEGTEVEAYLRAFKGEFSGHWAHGSRILDVNALREVGRRAGMYATITSSKAEFTPGKYDVILSPLVVGNLIDTIGWMASAMAVMMGFSMFMKVKPGDKVGSEAVTIIDAPRDTELAESTAFDDEGVPTKDKPIIKNGVLVNILHNTGTAKKIGTESTGNAGWLFPTPWNLHVAPGDVKSEEELFSELRNGVIITNNWYTRLQNYVEGIFSTVSRDAALLVKNGEIIGHLGRIRIADRFTNLLSNWELATKETHKIRWWEVETPTKAPYALIRQVNLTKPFI